MGTVTSGVGLISGLDYQSLIEQLIAIEAAPRDQIQNRISEIDAQRTAYMDISARISGMLSKVLSLTKRSFFTANKVNSSNANILSASATSSAAAGSYNFIVKSLATTHQLVSRGYTNRDAQLQSGELLIESARARTNNTTKIDELNGYRGVERGSFQIIDGDGQTAEINISSTATLGEVVDMINEAGINVSAQISGDGLVLTETNGGTLRVRERNGGRTAADLGFGAGNTYSTSGRIEGTNLMYLTTDTPLSALNDANGVRRTYGMSDFKINDMTVRLSEILDSETNLAVLNRGRGVELGTVRLTVADEEGTEHSYQVDLSGAQTAGDVKNALEGVVDDLTVTFVGDHLRLSYANGDATTSLKIEDVTGNAARDLGIEQTSESARIDGKSILHMDTLGAVMAAINNATGNDGLVTASLDGTRLVLSGSGDLQLSTMNNSGALADLGFTEGTYSGTVSGRRIIGGVDTTLLSTLNGGQGFTAGRINVQVGDAAMTFDLTGSETLQDVIERINTASETESFGLSVGYDQTGTRLVFESEDGTSPILITDAEGTFAADMGLVQEEGSATVRSDNLQKQYVSGALSLDNLNGGRGTTLGTMIITNSRGLSASIELANNSNITSLQDVIDQINVATLHDGSSLGVTARINDQGDGIVLEDSAGGDLGLKVSDESGSVARDLNIAGTSADGVIDGSQEISLTLTGGETLDDVVEMINERGGLATASVLNDGTGVAPWRLQLTSDTTGAGGELLVSGLGFTTMTDAQDAQVILGSNPNSGILISSASNTIENIVPGLTLDLTAASDEVVNVSVKRDVDSVVTTFSELVDNFNTVMSRIDELTSYDVDSETAGILLGDHTVLNIERRMQQMIMTNRTDPVGSLRRLSDFGIRFKDGALTLDEDKLRAVLNDNPEGAIEFFTDEENGFAIALQEKLEAITETGGLIDRYGNTLTAKKDQMTERVEVLNERLDRRQQQLLNQFLAMENALAMMQSQQNALTQLSALAGTTTSSSG